MARARQPISPVTKGIVVVSAIAGLLTLYSAWRRHLLSSADASGRCTVLGTDLAQNENDARNRYAALVTLEHRVGGERYEAVAEGPRTPDRGVAEAERRRFVVGSEVACSYVSSDPSLVTVFPHRPSGAVGLGAFGLFLLLGLPTTAVLIERSRSKGGRRKR